MEYQPIYQTDFDGIRKTDGCLVFSIQDMVAHVLMEKYGIQPRALSHTEIEVMHRHAWERGYLAFEQNGDYIDRRFGMYVLDHAAYANEVLSWHLQPHIRCEYVAADYMDSEWRNSWGCPKESDAIILQVATRTTGRGHFRRLNYDPYQPSPGILYIRSARYYRFFQIHAPVELAVA